MTGTWQPLNNQPTFDTDTMLLLTDGRVLCHEVDSNNWHSLKPDSSGSYVNGDWSQLASMLDNPTMPVSMGGPTYAPLYFASAVLKDGRVFVAGGEYNAGHEDAELLIAQIYDPVSDSWMDITPPATLRWTQLGDAPSCLLADGRVLIGSIEGNQTAIYDPSLNTWTLAASKADACGEETWTLLPDGTVLTVQCSNSPYAEKYLVARDQWVGAGSTIVDLTQPCRGYVAEIGPAVLLPDGRLFAIGASGNTALYTLPATPSDPGAWAVGPSFGCGNGDTDVVVSAAVSTIGQDTLIVADNGNNRTGILAWDGAALRPAWTSSQNMHGPAGTWVRGTDFIISADIDGDDLSEIVIGSSATAWTGVLKWNGAGLAPIWMSPSPLNSPAGGWNRTGYDSFLAADTDKDGHAEIVVINNHDLWIGVLKWDGSALVPIWMSPSPLPGPAGNWNRAASDNFLAADVDNDGRAEIIVTNNHNGWIGVLQWNGSALVPIWMSPSPLPGPAGNWNRAASDNFLAADVDNDRRAEIIVTNNHNGWIGVLQWNGSALVPIWMSPSPLPGPAGSWIRALYDSFLAADIDKDGRTEIVTANNQDGRTGVLRWNGSALVPVWMSASPLTGPAGNWNRGPDQLLAADVDADGKPEIAIWNNADRWIGLLKWNGAALVPVWMTPSKATFYPMDAPACLLPNGKVLCTAGPGMPCDYPPPTLFFEYDPAADALLQVSSPVKADGPCFSGRLLLLPTGQVLFGNHIAQIQVYSPDGVRNPNWAPNIISVPKVLDPRPGRKFKLVGTQLNGLSQAVSYGDDAQMATNYPIVRIAASDGNIYYCRTFDHSSMGVATGANPVETWCSLPSDIPQGQGHLVVVANGLHSLPVQITIAIPRERPRPVAWVYELIRRLFG
jgi:FG-GAP-like repeat